MSEFTVNLVSAFGRGESLALALAASGFTVKIIDFGAAFGDEFRPTLGPFPLVEQSFTLEQGEHFKGGLPLHQGLTFWLKNGPIELTGPFSDLHASHHPEILAWKNGTRSSDFKTAWLARFLKHWASPIFLDPWEESQDSSFPAELPLAIMSEPREAILQSFATAATRGIEVLSAKSLIDVQTLGSSLTEVLVEAGAHVAFKGEQWVWCLSSAETESLGKKACGKIFARGVHEPEWTWLSFQGSFLKGSWSSGLPDYSILLEDIYLPWTYANAVIVRRLDETRLQFWLKVPSARARDLDARRSWAAEVQAQLHARLSLADWKVDPFEWNLCPHSTIFSSTQMEQQIPNWRNWDWIAPETLPRLDVSARLSVEARALQRLTSWRSERLKKKGVARDQTLHAP